MQAACWCRFHKHNQNLQSLPRTLRPDQRSTSHATPCRWRHRNHLQSLKSEIGIELRCSSFGWDAKPARKPSLPWAVAARKLRQSQRESIITGPHPTAGECVRDRAEVLLCHSSTHRVLCAKHKLKHRFRHSCLIHTTTQ